MLTNTAISYQYYSVIRVSFLKHIVVSTNILTIFEGNSPRTQQEVHTNCVIVGKWDYVCKMSGTAGANTNYCLTAFKNGFSFLHLQ